MELPRRHLREAREERQAEGAQGGAGPGDDGASPGDFRFQGKNHGEEKKDNKKKTFFSAGIRTPAKIYTFCLGRGTQSDPTKAKQKKGGANSGEVFGG